MSLVCRWENKVDGVENALHRKSEDMVLRSSHWSPEEEDEEGPPRPPPTGQGRVPWPEQRGPTTPARGELRLFHSRRGPVLASCSAVAILKFSIILRGSTFSFCIEPAHYVAGRSGEPALLPIPRRSPAARRLLWSETQAGSWVHTQQQGDGVQHQMWLLKSLPPVTRTRLNTSQVPGVPWISACGRVWVAPFFSLSIKQLGYLKYEKLWNHESTLFEVWGRKDFDGERKDSYFHFKQGKRGRDFCEKVIAWTSLSRVLDRDPVETVL